MPRASPSKDAKVSQDHYGTGEREDVPAVALRHYAHHKLNSIFDSLLGPVQYSSISDEQNMKAQMPVTHHLSGHNDRCEPPESHNSHPSERSDERCPWLSGQSRHAFTPINHPESTFVFPPGVFPLMDLSSTSTWVLPFLISDPYSPLHLRHIRAEGSSRQKSTPDWTAAFEDLLLASKGLELPPRAIDSPTTAHSSSSLLQNQITNDNLHTRHLSGQNVFDALPIHPLFRSGSYSSRHSPSSTEQASQTELDLYTHFLSSLTPSLSEHNHSQNTTYSQLNTGNHPNDDHHRPGHPQSGKQVLSTLTTTTRTTSPDGSITTTTVLKRRFGDGTEETKEVVDTNHSEMAHQSLMDSSRHPRKVEWTDMATTEGHASDEVAQKEPERSNGGWFWSR